MGCCGHRKSYQFGLRQILDECDSLPSASEHCAKGWAEISGEVKSPNPIRGASAKTSHVAPESGPKQAAKGSVSKPKRRGGKAFVRPRRRRISTGRIKPRLRTGVTVARKQRQN